MGYGFCPDKTIIQKDTCTLVFTAALFTTSNQQQMTIDKWIKKMWYIYIHKGTLLSHKKNKTMPFIATWMKLETIILSEVSQRDKYHVVSLICGI